LNLSEAIVSAVSDMGYTQPTPIQTQAIPLILQGKDLLAGAQTGTGKTAAFALPLLEMLSRQPQDERGKRPVRALILTPTRELAAQIEENIRAYAKNLPLRATVIFGGVGMAAQIAQLNRGVDILVATPGRLLDLQSQSHADLSQVEFLVLDEADRMLDMGFIHDVRKVLALLPRQKQSLLFSATFSDDIKQLANTLLNQPEQVQVTPPNTTVQRISQVICPVGRNQKKAALLHIITSRNWNQVLVFTRTKFGANHVAEYLNKHGVSAMALHGNKSQTARTQALAGFKTGQLRALVATDIAARGIDIDELPHVVNYEIPNVPEDYVHRIGRTGRAGADGHAISLVCLDEEGFMMEIERFTKQEIPVDIMSEFAPEADEVAEPIAMGRQTLWGGAGRPPGRDVMQAAAKKARKEMLDRVRTKTPPSASPRSAPAGDAAQAFSDDESGGRPAARQGQGRNRAATPHSGKPRSSGPQNRQGQGNRPAGGGNAGNGRGAAPRSAAQDYPAKERLPLLREDAHLGTQAGTSLAAPRRSGGTGQPDPMRTSVDSMTQRNGRNRSQRGFAGGGGGAGHFNNGHPAAPRGPRNNNGRSGGGRRGGMA
jgi:ATP-dependent RNA helicase RhlE